MCYGKSVDIVVMYNWKQKWVTAVWADALEIKYTFYRNYRYCELSGMDVYSGYTKYGIYLISTIIVNYQGQEGGVASGRGQWI